MASANYVDGGAVDPNQSVIQQGWWFIHKHLKNINNDLRLSKELFEGNTLTAGVYLAHYTDDDKWALGNQMLMTNTPNARPITVSYVNGGQTYQLTDGQGFLDNGGYNITEHGTRHQQGVLPVRLLAHRQVAVRPVRPHREPGRHQHRVQPDQRRPGWQPATRSTTTACRSVTARSRAPTTTRPTPRGRSA